MSRRMMAEKWKGSNVIDTTTDPAEIIILGLIHQTLKKRLAAQPPARLITELQ